MPEAARQNWFGEKKQKDDITGFWEELQSDRGADLRDSLESRGHWTIESKRLQVVLECTGDSFSRWRDCDFDTLQKIKSAIDTMMQKPFRPGILFLSTRPWCTEEVRKLLLCDVFATIVGSSYATLASYIEISHRGAIRFCVCSLCFEQSRRVCPASL